MGNPPARFGFRETQPVERKRHSPNHGGEHTLRTTVELSSVAIDDGESDQKTRDDSGVDKIA
ncbi:hypothetical protein Bca101_053923 [Brassica carinata]